MTDLTGSIVAIWLIPNTFRQALGYSKAVPDDEQETGVPWSIGGEIEGETPIGLLLRVEVVRTPKKQIISMKPPQRYLIRWDYVATMKFTSNSTAPADWIVGFQAPVIAEDA
jgi:hypothetical protein